MVMLISLSLSVSLSPLLLPLFLPSFFPLLYVVVVRGEGGMTIGEVGTEIQGPRQVDEIGKALICWPPDYDLVNTTVALIPIH